MHNKHDHNRSNFDNTYFDKIPAVKNKSLETPLFKITRKKKVFVVGDSITKFLCYEKVIISVKC